MELIPDQRVVWDAKHARGDHAEFRLMPGPFGTEAETYFPNRATLLDLGCGVGGDAMYFARMGHNVVAADFSEVVIEQNKRLLEHPNLHFMLFDIEFYPPFKAQSFDAVFAHLSLHYYHDNTTKDIFRDIADILKPNGILAFACKTPNDPEYGQGQEIEPNFFVSDRGHVRHFFTESYARELLAEQFEILSLKEVDTTREKQASFIQVVARKRALNND